MKVEGAESFDSGAVCSEPCAVAIGIFDAVHKGHLRVLSAAKDFAAQNGAKAFVLTFYPHPAKIFARKNGGSALIYPPETRAKLLLEAGMDAVFFKDFTPEFAALGAREFFALLVKKFPGLKCVATGENFKFGAKAAAGVDVLKSVAAEFGVETRAVGGVLNGGEFVSSTRLRAALQKGDMELFLELGGRDYFCEGAVEGGEKLGRKIGFPTLNLAPKGECLPPFGAYAARLENADTKEIFEGVSNFGAKPTVGNFAPVLETHLFREPNFGEGANVKVELLKFLRAEKKFGSLEELKSQIALDKAAAQNFFNANK
ncbi:MAG: riboflavin biosynthesis protein RibF [Opitutales bacterium]|nr:riboflavin biosynthesis protein RibF [Opitutales bacterium]